MPVKYLRLLCAGLMAFALTSLAACGSDDDTTATPGASSTAAESAPSSPATAKLSDSELCDKYSAAKKEMTDSLIAGFDAEGNIEPAKAKKILTDLSGALTTASAGGSSEVATLMAELGAQAAQAAAAPDPAKATEEDSFGKPGDRLDVLCKAA